MTRLVLLRHGMTEANERRLYCGSADLPLSPAGRAALEALREAGGYPPLNGLRVYTSGMRRAEETLRVLYGDVPHERERDLREVDFGAFELRSWEELRGDAAYEAWCAGDSERSRCPGGESGALMRARVLAALGRILRGGGGALLVTHGGPVAAILDHFYPEAGKNRWQWQPRPGEGYALLLGPDGRPVSREAVPRAAGDLRTI